MKNLFLTAALLAALVCLLPHTVAAKEKKIKKIPTAQFRQYGLDPGPVQSQIKSDIEISLKVIRISDIYQYPDMFAFNLEDILYERDFFMTLNRMYPKGPLGKSWENPFSTQDGTEQLLICQAKIKNNTEHILRMKDTSDVK